VRLVKTHGSLNEIFALDAAPDAWESDEALREFAVRVCDRSAWTGGSDGIYLYDAGDEHATAWFFNPDGSSAEFCGNGMRGLGRLILDLRGTDTEVIASSGRDYTVHRTPSTAEGVRQVLLELPPLRFDDSALPEPFQDFTAVAVPNPHVIAMVARYSELDLIELGKRADEVFAAGANVSFLQPLSGGDTPEVFVRTFERGAGLTPSCGSGVVASRAAYSRVSGLDPEQRVVVRNAGGVSAASIQVRDGAWWPVLEGNATVVYRAEVDPDGGQVGPVEQAADENAAYVTLDEGNTAYLKSHGIETVHP
jgi:diaminopimelate epimerase